MCSVEEKRSIDLVIDSGPRPAGEMDFTVLHGNNNLSDSVVTGGFIKGIAIIRAVMSNV